MRHFFSILLVVCFLGASLQSCKQSNKAISKGVANNEYLIAADGGIQGLYDHDVQRAGEDKLCPDRCG